MVKSDGGVQDNLVRYGGPGEIAQRDKTRAGIAPRHGERPEARLREFRSVDQNGAMPAVQVIDARQFGELLIAQEPGVAIDFGRQNQAAVEGLQNQVVLPEIETGGETDAVILGEPLESRHQSAESAPGAVVRGGAGVGHVDVDIGLFALP